MKEKAARALLDDYLARIRRHVPCDEVEVREDDRVEAAFRKAIPPRACTVALEVTGDALSSERFAALVGRVRDGGHAALVLMVGGAYGLPAALSRSADHRVSLGPMTLPHRLARIVLAEQLYRALTILAGEPYHHGG